MVITLLSTSTPTANTSCVRSHRGIFGFRWCLFESYLNQKESTFVDEVSPESNPSYLFIGNEFNMLPCQTVRLPESAIIINTT